jgi:hypothetical protein
MATKCFAKLLNFGGWLLVLTKVIAGEGLAVGSAIIAGHVKILQTENLKFTLKLSKVWQYTTKL